MKGITRLAITAPAVACAFFLLSTVAVLHIAPFSLGGMGMQYRFLLTALVAYMVYKRVK